MRLVLPTFVLAFLLLGGLSVGSAADGPMGVRKKMPRNLAALESSLDDLGGRIRRLLEAANLDPAQKTIERYRKYTPKQLKKIRGRVRAEELVGFMVDDPDRDFLTVRKAAMEAILDGARFRGDPELSDSEKSGNRTKRAYFCEKKLVPYLKSKVGSKPVDRFARSLVHELLVKFYPAAPRTHPEIKIYNPDSDKSWGPAQGAWKRFLKKN